MSTSHKGMATIPTELGTRKVSSLLKEYAVPAIIAMTASSLYNMVDGIYIGHIKDVGAYAISGLAVTFPLMNLSTALGTLVGVGAATMLSVLLGQKNYEAADKVMGNVMSMTTIIGLMFTVFALAFLSPILYFFGASENTLPFATEYMRIILIGNVVTHLYFGLNNCVRSSGNPQMAMRLTIFTVLFNSILDPILIFGFGMGIKGAAIATVAAQLVALCVEVRYFMTPGNFPQLPRGIFRLDLRIAESSLTIGMGPFLMNSAACIVSLFINQQLRKYGGDLSIGAYGIVNRIAFLFIMIVMGFNQGMQPIVGYNYGARQYRRVKEACKLTTFWATIVMTVAFLCAQLIPGPVVSIFTNDAALKELSVHGLRCTCLVMPIIGFQMVATNCFQCLGMVHKSITLSLSRQLIFLVPLVYFLPLHFGVKGVWYAFPASDSLAAVMAFFFVISLFKKLNKLNDGDDPSILGSKI